MSSEPAHTGRILIYQNEKGDTKIDVYFEEDTIWMTQRSMAELYQVTPQNITTHIKHIYEDGELDQWKEIVKSAAIQSFTILT